jgi:hypothetical protein
MLGGRIFPLARGPRRIEKQIVSPASLSPISRRAITAIIAMGLMAGACAPGHAPAPRDVTETAPDTLYGWLQMVWGGTGGQVSYALTDSAGRTTPLQLSDSLAAAANVRALDRGWVRVISDGRSASGAARVRSLAPSPPPARP